MGRVLNDGACSVVATGRTVDVPVCAIRTAVMERHAVMTADQLANPLLRETKAWKSGRVVFVDADAWYITGASPTSLKLLIDDVIKGYKR